MARANGSSVLWGWIAVTASAAAMMVLDSVLDLSMPLGPAAATVLLYNRVQRDGSFENETRRRIFDSVRTRPGQSIAEIATTIGVSHSTASYHLDRLIEFNLLAATQDGNKMRFFVNGGTFTDEERRVLSALSNPETRRMLETVVANPGSYRAELTNTLGVSSPTVNWHLSRLLAANLVREEPRGRNRYLYADAHRLRRLFDSLLSKIEETEYDGDGLRRLATLCR